MNVLKIIGKNIGAIILAIAVLLIGVVVGDLGRNLFSDYYLKLMVSCVLRVASTMALAWFVSVKLLKISPDELGIKPKRIELKWIIIAIALPVLVLVFYAFVLPGKAHIAENDMLCKTLFRAIFETGITVGIAEELVFRGMIFRYMKKTLGVKLAVIIPAVLFAILHIMNMQTFNLTDLILLVLAGSSVAVMFTLMALDSGSIYPGALVHALWNALIIGGIFGVGAIVNGAPNTAYIVIPVESASKLLTGGNFGVEAAVPAIVCYIAAAVICFVWYKKKLKRAESQAG